MPTPYYSPSGPFDWWHWYFYSTKAQKPSLTTHSVKFTTATTTTTTTTTTKRTTTTSKTTTSTTTTTTTTTRRTTIRTTTANLRLTNKTSTQSKVTLGWPKLPGQTSKNSAIDGRLDDYEKEYEEWRKYLTTDQNQEEMTSTAVNPLTSVSPRQQYQPIGHLPTKATWKIVTINTPSAKRPQPSNSVISERNPVTTLTNGMIRLIK